MTQNPTPPPIALTDFALLSALTAAEREAFAQKCRVRKFAAGEHIIDGQSESRDVYIILEGTVRIANYALSGREVTLDDVGPGGYFGEMAAIDGEPRSAAGVALDPCLIATLAPDLFRDLIERHPQIAVRVIEKLARIIRDCDERIMDLATLGAYQRVYREILKRARPDPLRAGSWLVYPLPTQVDIAAHASTTRETVARVLSSLAQSEIVGRKGKTLYIRDRKRLESLIERTDIGQNAAS